MREVRLWQFSEALDPRAKVCLSEKFGHARERARLPPLTPSGPSAAVTSQSEVTLMLIKSSAVSFSSTSASISLSRSADTWQLKLQNPSHVATSMR